MVELIIFRTLQSIGISAALTLGGGIVGDLFIPFGKLQLRKHLFFLKSITLLF